jgi:hypothetical protein
VFDNPSQQWQTGGRKIVNIGNNMCLAMQLDTSDWTRIGGAEGGQSQALITVAHQPEVCLSCATSASAIASTSARASSAANNLAAANGTTTSTSNVGVSGAICKVGDRPKLQSCEGTIDTSRLSWEFMPLKQPTLLTGNTGECTPGINMWFGDLPSMPVYGYTVLQCQNLCESTADCKAYVFQEKGCEEATAPRCWLKNTGQYAEKSEACSCMGIMAAPEYLMCPTASVPSTSDHGRDLLPTGTPCDNLPKEAVSDLRVQQSAQ